MSIINLILEQRLRGFPSETVQLEDLDQADSHACLAQYVCQILSQSLGQVRSAPSLKGEAERSASRLQNQITLCNEIIEAIQAAR